MISEQQASKELIVRNWSLSYFEELGKIDSGLKQLGISPDHAEQFLESAGELKDTDFRAAAFDLLDLKKGAKKTWKEAEVYIKALDSQIVAREKQSSDWTAKIEKARSELKDWEQKRNDERARFESERARNMLILKEDGEKLKRELTTNNEVRENIEETVALKIELKKINLDLPAFKSVVEETVLKGGVSPRTAEIIREALKRLGSLEKAIAEKEKEENARQRSILDLSRQEAEKKKTLQEVNDQVTAKKGTIMQEDKLIEEGTKLLESYDSRIEQNKWQYEFFQLFISMLLTSPSAAESAEAIGVLGSRASPLTALGLRIRALSEKGWTHSTELTAAQRRAAFIMIVMGVYLHSIHCGKCGASFIVNKAYNAYSSYRSSYYCPVCDFQLYTKPDDTFFDLMVSPELAKKLQATMALLNIMGKTDFEAVAKKLKLLDSLPNEVIKALSDGHRIEVKVLDGTD